MNPRHDDNPPLPAPFVWTRVYQDAEREDVNLRLGIGGEAIAAVSVMDGVWHATVNLHLSSHRGSGASCASCEQGRRWVTRWLETRAGRILIDIGEERERLRAMGRKSDR